MILYSYKQFSYIYEELHTLRQLKNSFLDVILSSVCEPIVLKRIEFHVLFGSVHLLYLLRHPLCVTYPGDFMANFKWLVSLLTINYHLVS
jgi:hypothetical protein